MITLAMIQSSRLTSVSTTSSSSSSWARCDEGSDLWHVVSAGDQKKGRKKPRSKRRKKQKKPGNASSKSSDDEYYLRWNASGDFDSDDDEWWSEVTALEREGRQEEQSLYLQYKYHTKRVIEWGNSFFDKGNQVRSNLSLRMILWRLNDLAIRGISMPPTIYRNLELAVALREEFQNRFVSEPKTESENREFRKKRRDFWKPNDPSAMLSPWPRNVGIDTDDDAYTVEDSMSYKYDSHRWMLNQLKLLLNKFDHDFVSEIIDSVGESGDHSSMLHKTKTSGGSESGIGERSDGTLTNSRTIEKCSSENIQKRSMEDEHKDESTPLEPSEEDDERTTMLSTCVSSSLGGILSPIGDTNQRTDQSSAWHSNSSSENWDKLFGDDGSLIGNSKDRDCYPATQRNEPQKVSNSEISQDTHSKITKVEPYQNATTNAMNFPSGLKKRCSGVLSDKVAVLSDSSKNSIRKGFLPPRKHNYPKGSIKSMVSVPTENKSTDNMSHKKARRQTPGNESDDILLVLGSSTISNIAFSSLARTQKADRLDHSNKCDSVWDLGSEEVSVPENVITISTPDKIPLLNSEPPEDWELLLEEDEEEEDSKIEESGSKVAIAREKEEKSTRVALPTKEFGVNKIEFSKRKKIGIENHHPNHNNRQHISDRGFPNAKKSTYVLRSR